MFNSTYSSPSNSRRFSMGREAKRPGIAARRLSTRARISSCCRAVCAPNHFFFFSAAVASTLARAGIIKEKIAFSSLVRARPAVPVLAKTTTPSLSSGMMRAGRGPPAIAAVLGMREHEHDLTYHRSCLSLQPLFEPRVGSASRIGRVHRPRLQPERDYVGSG